MLVALVAMSGVRVRNAELAALGVSLPGFVERGRVIASLPSLGLLTLAGATPDGIGLDYFEHGDVTPDELADDGYDLVAISTFTAQAPEAYEFADACRSKGLRVAMGGLHVTVRPKEALDHADHVFVGEGERTWPRFLADLSRGRARAVYTAAPFPLSESPAPRFDLLDPGRYNRLTIQTTRGCPRRCTFCASGNLLGTQYRRKPVELVARDLEAIRKVWPQPFIELADDNTFVNRAWGRRLVRTLREFRIRWFTETDLTVAEDEELLELLGESGCRQLLIGFEALDPQTVRELEERPFKSRLVDRYRSSIRRIQGHGVSVNGCFILGADHHTPDVFPRVAEFADRVGLAEVQVTVLTPFPGTRLYDRMLREGRMLKTDDWGGMTLFDVTYRPARMSIRELEDGMKDLFWRLYTPDRVRARQRSFRRHYRDGRSVRRCRSP